MGSGIAKLVFPAPEVSYEWDPFWIWLTTSEREVIPAFYLDKGAKYTLLFSHGNAEDLGNVIDRISKLAVQLKVNVFAYEYTGYGLSSGEASEQAAYADIEAAFAYLRDVIGIPWEQIVLYGWSLGSGPSVHLAARGGPVRGLVLHSSFASICRVAIPTRASLPGDVFPNLETIGEVSCPVLIVHGVDDDITPIWHARELHAGCRKESAYAPLFVDEAGHDDLEFVAGDVFIEHLTGFLASLDAAPPLKDVDTKSEDDRQRTFQDLQEGIESITV